MIENPEDYFERLIPDRNILLKELEKEADRENIPIIGPVVGELLNILARSINAGNILELGTAIGYSTIFLADAVSENDGRVVSFEKNKERSKRATINIEKAGLAKNTDVIVGDAFSEISVMEDRFDMIFLDVEKSDYIRGLSSFYQLLRPNGLLIADNVGFIDADPFNQAILTDVGWKVVNLYAFLPLHSPVHDGLSIALRV